MNEIYYTTSGQQTSIEGEWQAPNTYRIMAWVIPESEGGFSVVSINLPGCATQGETIDECIANLKEAAAGLIESYKANGQEIPWVKSGPMSDRPSNANRMTVFVTVPQ